MLQSLRGTLAFATLTSSLLCCANDLESSTSPGNGAQANARAGEAAPPTVSNNPTVPTGDRATSPASDKPNTSASEMRAPAGSETSTPTLTPSSAAIDPTGVWWTEVTTVGSEVLPILDRLDGTDIRFVMRVEVSGTAPDNTAKFEFCQLQTEWIDPADPNNITTIGFRPDTVAAFSETISVDLGKLSAGSKVPLPSLTFRGGTDESGKEIDEDGDGNPAVTAWVRTLLGIEIEVYETITIRASLDLSVPDENTLTGTLDFGADALIVTSNNVIIGAGTAVTITPDSKAVPLTAKRLPSGGGCSALPSTIVFTPVPPAPPPLIPPPAPSTP